MQRFEVFILWLSSFHVAQLKQKSKFVFASTMNAFGMDKKRKKLVTAIVCLFLFQEMRRLKTEWRILCGLKRNEKTHCVKKSQKASFWICKNCYAGGNSKTITGKTFEA